jgi:hypothetical protein
MNISSYHRKAPWPLSLGKQLSFSLGNYIVLAHSDVIGDTSMKLAR